jgi:hypothetical protein
LTLENHTDGRSRGFRNFDKYLDLFKEGDLPDNLKYLCFRNSCNNGGHPING